MTAREGKAAGFISYVDALRDMLGPSRFAAVVAQLPSETRTLVEKPPVPMSWLPMTHAFALHQAALQQAFANDAEAMFEVGRRQMHRDMSTIYKVFMFLASPESLLKKAATIYSTYSRNGRMSARPLGDNASEVTLEDVEGADPAWWSYQRGCVTGVLEAARTRGLAVELIDGGGTARRATWRITWA